MERLFDSSNQQTQPEQETRYEFFDYKGEREELFKYSKAIAEYLRKESIPNLVIVDRSSRPLYIGVRMYLREKYPDEKMPNIYFMNPKGFKAREKLTNDDIEEIIADCEWKGDAEEAPNQVRTIEEIMQEFEEAYRYLMQDKDKPVLVFDTCIHTGGSLEPVKDAFDNSGFSDVRIGAVNPSEHGARVKTDFFITTRRPEKGCYPFDRDRMIEKTFDNVYSKRSEDARKRNSAIRLRQEIKRIMGDFLEKDRNVISRGRSSTGEMTR